MKRAHRKSQFFIRSFSNFLRRIFYFDPNLLNIPKEHTHRWYKVLCLVGLDYFSTLAYQPALAVMAVGLLAPFASLLLVLVTLFAALPTYFAISQRSFAGLGSIAMLEKLVKGWLGKFLLLALIAFAVTDFMITITLSTSDAAAHLVDNPMLAHYFAESALWGKLSISLTMVSLLGLIFFFGIREAVTMAVLICVPFLLLTFTVIVRALYELFLHPSLFSNWINNPVFEVSHVSFFLVIMIAFPKLALGLSGFETSVSTMPLVYTKDESAPVPTERIAGTKKMLFTSAIIMSVCLLTSSLVASIFLTSEQVADGGDAAGRALSYLGHSFLGNTFGNLYDIFTIFILWFAGASAMAGLLAILPRYLPRFGMAPKWILLRKPVVIMIISICFVILILFRASVSAQSGAYATGVLALLLSGAVAVTISFYKEWKISKTRILLYKCMYFFGVSIVFVYTLLDNIFIRPDGLIIASIFFVFILIGSSVSRWARASELRVADFTFMNEKSEELFDSLKDHKVDLVPVAFTSSKELEAKTEKIKHYYKVDSPLAFVSITLRDDRSVFDSDLQISVESVRIEKRIHYLIRVSGAVAIPNTVAYIIDQLMPNTVYLGLARKNAMEQALSYVLFGEGEIGILTYKVLVQHWESEKGKRKKGPQKVRPVILLISE